jgi:DNA repair exonuclease SbcCD nuclease subunit
MALIIYTDPHLGVTRTGNTTPRSRQLLRDSICNTLDDILMMKGADDHLICLGDLFDSYSNSEAIISEGMQVVARTDLTLAGNHDVVADADKVGSLGLIAEHYPDKVCMAPFNQPFADGMTIGDVNVVAVPHVTTQTLFEESLDMAAHLMTDKQIDLSLPSVLCLHCNLESPHALTETSLNLTKERAEELLGTFGYIFCGHEHQPRDLFDGRLIILGNVHPTGFADISDKRIAILDASGVRFQQVWGKDENYAEWDVNEDPPLDSTDAQFVRIKGSVPSENIAQVSKAVNRLWKTSPGLLALRSEVTVDDIVQEQQDDGATAETLPSLIAKELESSPAMKAMWEEFTT